MNKNKNIVLIIFGILFSLFLTGCEKTMYEERTIIVNLESEVIPTVTSTYGSGELDDSTMVYTHKIDCIKDVYLYFSFNNLQTETLYISTSEMSEAVITRNVKFGNPLNATIDVELLGVKSLEGLTITSPSNYEKLEITGKNTFNITIPNRNEDIDLKFSLDGYKECVYEFSKDGIVSGYKKITLPALLEGEMYVAVTGYCYRYAIYSNSTDLKVTEGSIYDYSLNTKYIILPDDDTYYAEFSFDYDYTVYNIGNENNTEIDISHFYRLEQNTDYFIYSFDFEYAYAYLYYKDRNLLYPNNHVISAYDNIGVLVLSFDGEYMYCDDINDYASRLSGNTCDIILQIPYSAFESVSFDVESTNIFTGEIEEDYFDLQRQVEATYSNGVFEIKNEIIPSGFVLYDLVDEKGTLLYSYKDKISYDEEGNLVYGYEHFSSIHPLFEGSIISGTISYDNNIYYYMDSLCLEDLRYNGTYYEIDPIVVNTNKRYSQVLVARGETKEQGFDRIWYSSDIVAIDENMNIITPINGHGVAYFDFEPNVTYTIKTFEKSYTVTPTPEELDTGLVFCANFEVETVKIKVPNYLSVMLYEYSNMIYYPDSDGYVYLPKISEVFDLKVIYNGKEEFHANIIPDDNFEYEIGDVVAVKDNYIIGNGYDITEFKYEVDVIYYYIPKFNSLEYIYTSHYLKQYDGSNGTYNQYQIPKSDFVFSEELSAYYYDISEHFDYVITASDNFTFNNLLFDYAVCNGEYYDKIYVNKGTVITYNDKTYVIGDYDSKELEIVFSYSRLEIREK